MWACKNLIGSSMKSPFAILLKADTKNYNRQGFKVFRFVITV
jgi:hypothetical protein